MKMHTIHVRSTAKCKNVNTEHCFLHKTVFIVTLTLLVKKLLWQYKISVRRNNNVD